MAKSSKNVEFSVKSLPFAGMVPMNLIVRDDDFNARKAVNLSASDDPEKSAKPSTSTEVGAQTIKGLAANMAAEGQTTPILLRPTPGKPGSYSLVAGFRRHSAAMLLNWSEIRAEIREMSELDAHIANLGENVARKSLTPYELAGAVVNLRDNFGLKLGMCAQRLAISAGYVTFLTSILDKCHPAILRSWASGKFPGVLTVDSLYRMSKTDSDAQNTAFARSCGEHGLNPATGEAAPVVITVRAEKAKQASPAELKAALSALGSADLPTDYIKGVREALVFALGSAKTIGKWFDLVSVEKAMEKREKAVKAKAIAEKAAAKAAKLESDL